MRPRVARTDLPGEAGNGLPSKATLTSLITACVMIGVAILGLSNGGLRKSNVDLYRVYPRSPWPYVIFTNDAEQPVVLMRCFNDCSQPDAMLSWRVEPGNVMYIPMHSDSAWMVVLNADRTVRGCIPVPRNSRNIVQRAISEMTACPQP
jgi:hypothetical protein